MHPVGSYYLSENATSPASLFGGTWEQIKDRFLVGAGNSYGVGATGGEASHTLSVAEMPKHSHTRGTMNITGRVGAVAGYYNEGLPADAFYSSGTQGCSRGNDSRNIAYFDASRKWTGETSSAGSGSAHNNMPPYRAIYMWKRTA